jgi:integrase
VSVAGLNPPGRLLRDHPRCRPLRGSRVASFLGRSPDTATPEELRAFQLHLTETGLQQSSINATVTALRFFFKVTLDRPETTRRLVFVYEPRKLPRVLSPEEVLRLLEIGVRSRRQKSEPHCSLFERRGDANCLAGAVPHRVGATSLDLRSNGYNKGRWSVHLSKAIGGTLPI